MKASRTQRSTPAMAEPRIEIDDDEVMKGVAKTRMHKRATGKKRSPAKRKAGARTGR